jgi:hypothetical protein
MEKWPFLLQLLVCSLINQAFVQGHHIQQQIPCITPARLVVSPLLSSPIRVSLEKQASARKISNNRSDAD